jgi:hypothetical protein
MVAAPTHDVQGDDCGTPQPASDVRAPLFLFAGRGEQTPLIHHPHTLLCCSSFHRCRTAAHAERCPPPPSPSLQSQQQPPVPDRFQLHPWLHLSRKRTYTPSKKQQTPAKAPKRDFGEGGEAQRDARERSPARACWPYFLFAIRHCGSDVVQFWAFESSGGVTCSEQKNQPSAQRCLIRSVALFFCKPNVRGFACSFRLRCRAESPTTTPGLLASDPAPAATTYKPCACV